jgi:hypothetical protein
MDELSDVPKGQLVHDIGPMGLYRLRGNSKFLGNFSVFETFRNQFQHLALSFGNFPRADDSRENFFILFLLFFHFIFIPFFKAIFRFELIDGYMERRINKTIPERLQTQWRPDR